MQDSRITVIIPVYKNKVHLAACVNSVLAADCASLERIILINDGSPEADVARYCRGLSTTPKMQLIENAENQGFVHAVNQGMAASDNDVVLLNSDTVVPEGWLDKIVAAAAQHPDAASITPFTNNGTICSYPNFCENNPLPEGLCLRQLNALCSEVNDGAVCDLPTAVGFCMYIRRKAIEEVGYFDEAGFGRGYGEENDFCMRATAQGWRHLLLGSVFVFHEGGVSFGDDANELQNHAMQVLEQRYPEYRKIISEHVSLDPARKLRENIDEARLSVDGQARLVLMESRARFNKLSTELKINAEAQEKTEHLLNHELQIARDFGKDKSLQLRALEKEMGSLETYAENRAAEATEYAGRIRQLEATATQLGENLRSMSERIGQYDLRVEQYDALLEEARGAYRESEAARRDLISINSALTQEKAALQQDNDELRSFLTVRIQLKLLQLMGKR